jgi:hypothetical protein
MFRIKVVSYVGTYVPKCSFFQGRHGIQNVSNRFWHLKAIFPILKFQKCRRSPTMEEGQCHKVSMRRRLAKTEAGVLSGFLRPWKSLCRCKSLCLLEKFAPFGKVCA